MKLPGIYVIYGAALSVFGHSISAIHTGLLIANSISIILIFLIAGRVLSSSISAVIAAGFYMIHNLSSSVQGIFANTEHFMIPFVLSAIWCLLISLNQEKNYFCLTAGILLGCAVLIKQHDFTFVIAGLGIMFYDIMINTRRWKKLIIRMLIFIIGVSLPYLTTCLIFILSGNFKNFIYWTFIHAREYVGLLTPAEGADHFKGNYILK